MSRKQPNRLARFIADCQRQLADRLLATDQLARVLAEVGNADFGMLVRWITDSCLLFSRLLEQHVINRNQLSIAVDAVTGTWMRRSPVLLDRVAEAAEESAVWLSHELVDSKIWSDPGQQSTAVQEALEAIAWNRVSVQNGLAVWEARTKNRKSAGAFYTPRYVVNYIVNGTLSDHQDLRLLDPACGTGRFLLGAFDAMSTRIGGAEPTLAESRQLLEQQIFGVDTDPWAISIADTTLKFRLLESCEQPMSNEELLLFLEPLRNLSCANSLTGDVDGNLEPQSFDAVIGNPPYRRERSSKSLMDEIAATDFGRRYRTARMDLWYYFVHRAAELLRPNGQLSFIVNSYWTSGAGAEKLLKTFRDELQLAEIFDLDDVPVFDGVAGQHMIFRARKSQTSDATLIRKLKLRDTKSGEGCLSGADPVIEFRKPPRDLFTPSGIDLSSPNSRDCEASFRNCVPLEALGLIRQGIAENPASINHRTNERFGDQWRVGDGVFVISQAELDAMKLSDAEQSLVRPYHQLKDLGRYRVADRCSHYLIYSTKQTCPEIERHPLLHRHLARFRPVMESRRETRAEKNKWWHLHWPRDESLWKQSKIVCLQMASRPSFAVARSDTYVSFSANVFVPRDLRESLDYVAAVLNSKVLVDWFERHAKRRGIGLDISGRVLRQVPVRRINFDNPREVELHSQLTRDAVEMSGLQRQLHAVTEANNDAAIVANEIEALDQQIDSAVDELYSG